MSIKARIRHWLGIEGELTAIADAISTTVKALQRVDAAVYAEQQDRERLTRRVDTVSHQIIRKPEPVLWNGHYYAAASLLPIQRPYWSSKRFRIRPRMPQD